MSVLDDMTKGITERKAKAAGPKLTPVGTEASPTKPSIPADLPKRFMAGEELTEVARDLRARAEQLVAIADALDDYAGSSSQPVVDTKAAAADAQREKEREADEKHRARLAEAEAKKAAELPELDVDADVAEGFTERLERLSKEAQAAVFTAADDTAEEPEKTAGWACPTHLRANLKTTTSRKGRTYSMCVAPGCDEFER